MAKENLTERRIENAACPPGKKMTLLYDARQPGLAVRIYAGGTKSYVAWYRPNGGGRSAPVRWLPIGKVGAISLDDARTATRKKLGEVAGGADPLVERRKEARRQQLRLKGALDAYEEALQHRGVVKWKEYLSVLRRDLLRPLGNMPLDEIQLETITKRINAIMPQRPGAASELRSRASSFFNWAAGEGLIKVSPLAGYRQPRRTRKQLLDEEAERQKARYLTDAEIPIFWRAAESAGWPFGPYLQTLLLTGQRRTETAKMRWADLDLDAGVWSIPAKDTKSGRAHDVPLPPQLITILEKQPRLNRCPYVFPGRGGALMSGWSKRLRPIYAATDGAGMDPWTLHDLRRTVKTGMTALGVEDEVSEMILNHQIGDELRRIYDKFGYPEKRREAALLWGRHVGRLAQSETAQRRL